jgi:hypothetical protein
MNTFDFLYFDDLFNHKAHKNIPNKPTTPERD